ncbi:hypothetical protein Tco_0462576 [Tanacetum coccineum]
MLNNLRKALDEAQIALDSDPDNANLRQQEAVALNAFNDALLTEERFLNQKAKIDWLKYGDANSAYFHKMVPMAFIDHYTDFLGKEGDTTGLDSVNLFQRRLSIEEASHMIREITNKEIHDAIFAMGDNKAPGPDGYSAFFFKEAWDIVGGDIIKAVKEFFTNGVLLKELNHTIIALIPKYHL